MAQPKRSSNTAKKASQAKSPKARSTAASRSAAGARAATSAKAAKTGKPRPAEAEAPRKPPAVDRDSRRQIAGVVVAVIGLAALIAVLTPSTGVLAKAVSDALRTAFGVGAFILPAALIAWSLTFFMDGRSIVPGRVAAGLGILAVAAIGIVGITTPNADVSTSILFNQYVLVDRGGFVGNGLAWVLITLLGKVAGIVVLAGLAVAGLVVIGLNFRDAVSDALERRAARQDLRRAQGGRRNAGRAGGRSAAYRDDLPDDYVPTALFDPDRQPQAAGAYYGGRPVTGNLYPDGSFVPLSDDPDMVLSTLRTVPTTVIAGRGRAAEEATFGCGNVPRANSVQLQLAIDDRDPAVSRVQPQVEVVPSVGNVVREPSGDLDGDIPDDVGLPVACDPEEPSGDGAGQSTMMSGAESLRARRAARRAESASRWWDPKDERRRADFDPDALKGFSAAALPGVLPGAPTSFEDMQDGFERVVEENLDLADYEPSGELLLTEPVSAMPRDSEPEPAAAPAQADRAAIDRVPQAVERRAAGHAIEYSEQEAPAAAELPWVAPAAAPAPSPKAAPRPYRLPDPGVLQRGKQGLRKSPEQERQIAEMAQRLQNTLQEFGVKARVVDWVDGPTFTTYEVEPGEGVRVNKFTSLEDDIARALAQSSVRIYAPVPNTSYVGIEVPNKTKQTVFFGDVLPSVTGGPLDFAVGLDANGKPVHADLAKLPHLLIAGTTGSGKSVMVNTIVVSMLMRDTPDDMRLIMIDPKQVEFAGYNGIPHLIMPVVTDMKQASAALMWGVTEMDRRYRLFSNVGVRELKSYNAQVDAGVFADSEFPLQHLPSIVIVIDELADLMMVAKKDVEASIVRIAQLGRACGIHLVMATQRPSADVVTGLIRANVANRIGLKVAKGTDSKIVIDQTGAEKLLGNGDMLFLQTVYGDKPRRIQGCWLSDDEINRVVEQLKEQDCDEFSYQMAPLPGAQQAFGAIEPGPDGCPSGQAGAGNEDEPLAWQAARLVVENQLGSTSMVQRRLKLGYARAGRIMDMLEEMGVVGPARGSKPRDVLIRDLDELETLRGGLDTDVEDY